MVLNKCESELSDVLAELLNKCLKESCLLDFWKVSSVVSLFKNIWKRSITKNYHLVSGEMWKNET